MTKVEILSTVRAVMALACLPYAIRARMWFLTAAWVIAFAASVCLAAGVALVLVGVISMPLYGAWGIHTLYTTRRRRTEPYRRPR